MRTLLSMAALAAGLAWGADDAAAPVAPPVKLGWPAVAARPPRLVASLDSAGDLKSPDPDAVRLAKPYGVAVDAASRIFVADAGRRGILVYDRQAGTAVRWTGSAKFPLAGPVAVAASRDGRVLAVDGFQGHVVVFDGGGTPVAVFGKVVLKRPEGIAIDERAGRVYVGDVRLHEVLAFDLRTFQPVKGPAAQFAAPASLAVNSKGQLLVGDGRNCRVQMFDAGGEPVGRFPTQCGQPGAPGRPHAIAVGPDDRIYVANPDDDSLQVFSPEGKPRQLVRSLGAAANAGGLRTGLAVDGEARVYVLEQRSGEGRLRIFAPAGDPRRTAAAPADRGSR